MFVFVIAAQACVNITTDPAVVAQDPAFAITLGTQTAEVAAGTTIRTFIRTARANGFASAITYTVTGAPLGLTVSVASTSVADSSTLTFAASAELIAGRYPLVVMATADGVAPQQAAITLTVTESTHEGPLVDLVFAGAHTCALTITGAAYCWGFNGHGELGNGDTAVVTSTPVAVAGGLAFQTLSVSKVDGVTCGLTAAGAAYCWGHNAGGQLGDGTRSDRLTPTPVAGGLTFSSIAVGNSHVCGVATSGTAYCWGTSPNGAFGDGTVGTHLTPTATAAGLLLESIVAGSDYTCAVTTDGAAYCWGLGAQGQLGSGEAVMRTTPVAVAGGLTFLGLAAGGMSTCGVTNELATYCWGLNSNGQLDDSTLTTRKTPVAVQQAGGLTFTDLATGGGHTCGLTSGGQAYCWGSNSNGQLGIGSTTASRIPAAVSQPMGVTFVDVGAGSVHSCGLDTVGQAWCWGRNNFNQIGDGTATQRTTPTAVSH